MELDQDLKELFEKLNDELLFYKKWAIALIFIALSPVAIVFIFAVVPNLPDLSFADIGTYIGGVSAPFGAISGILFVYVAFLGQRQQLLYNQQEIRVNRKALQDSLKEQTDQRIAIESQNKQFQIQSFENVFFNLMELFEKQSKLVFSENYGEIQLIEQLKKFRAQVQVTILDPDWKKKPIPIRYKTIENCFDFFFTQGFSRIRTLAGATISVLFHLERNRDLIDHSYFLSLFYNTLNVNEQRVIFFSFFSSELHLNSDQRRVFLEFIKIFYSSHLIDNDIKELLPEF